jgi:DNA-binding transcriptional ArsR family regulator
VDLPVIARLDLFKALADPTRRTILDELTERDGQTLFELCGRLLMKHGIDSTRQAISQHLDVLEGPGLDRVERDGRYKFHYSSAHRSRRSETAGPSGTE